MSTEVAKRETVKTLLARQDYRMRFEEILRDRAPQFMASIVTVSSQGALTKCEPKSVIAAAAIAATLDLPIEKNLGFAHIVPYKTQAQFQMGYKGYIQLAMRTGQYKRMAAFAVNEEALMGFDEFREPIIDHNLIDETKEPAGYYFAFELINGFKHSAYWSKDKVEKHAQQYSQAYRHKKYDSPWYVNFDKMALKTVISNTIRQWGILSVEMRKALMHDQAAQDDIDSEPVYIDNESSATKAHVQSADDIIASAKKVEPEPQDAEFAEIPPEEITENGPKLDDLEPEAPKTRPKDRKQQEDAPAATSTTKPKKHRNPYKPMSAHGKVYDRLLREMRACKSAAEIDAWWNNYQGSIEELHSEYQTKLFAEQDKHLDEIAKAEAEQQQEKLPI